MYSFECRSPFDISSHRRRVYGAISLSRIVHSRMESASAFECSLFPLGRGSET